MIRVVLGIAIACALIGFLLGTWMAPAGLLSAGVSPEASSGSAAGFLGTSPQKSTGASQSEACPCAPVNEGASGAAVK